MWIHDPHANILGFSIGSAVFGGHINVRTDRPRHAASRLDFIDVQIPVSVSALDRPAFDRTQLCLFLSLFRLTSDAISTLQVYRVLKYKYKVLRVKSTLSTSTLKYLSTLKQVQVPKYMPYTPCLKNVPPLACHNFDTHEWILISFGRNVTDEVGNQKTLYVPPQVTCAFALPGKTGKHENHSSPKFTLTRSLTIPLCPKRITALPSEIFVLKSRHNINKTSVY